jgi:O-antigen ligase
MGFAAAFQSIVGGFQVVLRRKAFVLEGETMVRAAGTMMHPNLLAAFLLLTVPIFAALAVGSQNRRVRLAAAATTLTGTAGLAATMSRFPIVLFAAILFCLVLALLARKLIDVKRAIAWTALAAIATTAIALPFSGRIAERVAKNWKESVDFRANANAAAYRLFRENQLFGVGPTHYTTYMIKDNIAYRKLYKENVEDAKLTNVRYMLAVHNMYLLVLAETGLLGFAAFCCLIAVSLALGVRAVAFTDGDWRLASLGMTLGMAGMYGQGLTEYAMAMEQNFYPLLLTTALVGRAPALARAASVETSR